MTRLDLIALLIAAFLAGAYIALVIRALVESRARDRVNDAAMAALSPDALARLRAYIDDIDEHERQRVETRPERWGRIRAAEIAADEDQRARGIDPWTPVSLERDGAATHVHFPQR